MASIISSSVITIALFLGTSALAYTCFICEDNDIQKGFGIAAVLCGVATGIGSLIVVASSEIYDKKNNIKNEIF